MSKRFVLLILGLTVCLCAGCAVNPITGEEQFMLFPEEQDIAIGQKIAPDVEKELGGRIENESLQAYIDGVGRRIARVSHRPDWDYHFVAVQEKSLNAMALPGGHIFITKGMLKKLTTESQLAGILAHEVSHVVARDSSEALSRATAINLLLNVALSQESSEAAVMAAKLTRMVLDLQYSRTQEREADLAGLDYMVVAGYNPYGMVETMQMLEDESKLRPIEFFSTHPNPQNRVAYLTGRIQTRYRSTAGLKVGRQEYHKAVLEQLSSN